MDKIHEMVQWIQNIELSQIINIIISIVLIILTVIFSPIISYGVTKIFNWKKKSNEIKDGITYNTIKNFITVSGIFLATRLIGLSSEVNLFIEKMYRISIIWITAKTVADAFNRRKIFTAKLKEKDPMINLISKVVKFLLYIMAGYLTLKEFGYDLAGALTGLGLTSAIIALAAQDTVKEIFLGLTIFWDKPFAIGDWIEIGEVSGTVEDITFRSTKLRTTADTVITIQNSSISTQNVINWGVIKKRLYKANLKLPLETEEPTVEKVLNRIRFILRYNKDINRESINVQFNEIKDDGINIYIYLETSITNYIEYQKFCNKLNLTILNILETQGVKLAYPGQNIYIKNINSQGLEAESKKVITAKRQSKDTK